MSRMSTAASAPDGGACPGGRPAPGRGRRLVRRVARVVVKLFLVVTIASLTFNALVRPPQTLQAPDGRDVLVDGARVHYRVWGSHGTPIVLKPEDFR